MNISLRFALDNIADAQASIHLGHDNYPEYIERANNSFKHLTEDDLNTRHGRYAKRLLDALNWFNVEKG